MKLKKIILIIILIAILISIGVVIYFVINKNESKNENKNIDNIENSEQKSDSGKVDLEINDNYFIININEVYLNYKDYEGKSVSYEGFIYYDQKYNAMIVSRYYYCCGDDSYITGMECKYDGEKPQENQWVKVTGTIMINSETPSNIYPYVKVDTLEILDKEGEKYVYN